MPDVKFYEAFAEEADLLRRYLPREIEAAFTAEAVLESGDERPPATLISTRTQSILPVPWAGQVRGWLTRSTGYDHIQAFWSETGAAVPAGYLPDYCSHAVAEHAMLLLLNLLRGLPRQQRQFPAFERDGLTGRECYGLKLLLVGVGHIGGEIVDFGRALGMDVRGVDPVRKFEGMKYVTLAEGLAWCDAVICAASLTGTSRGMLARPAFAPARPGLFLVNISRGEITPAADMAALLDEGRLAGLAMDVFDDEGRLAAAMRAGREDDPAVRRIRRLIEDDRVILTPHNAFNTIEALERKVRDSAAAVVRFLKDGSFPHPVPQ